MSARRNAGRLKQTIGIARHAPAVTRGSTLTEFAFVLPLLAMILFGMIDFGRALYSYHFVSYAAREASRWASVRGRQCSPVLPGCPAGPLEIQNYVAGIVPPGIDTSPASLVVTSVWMAPPENPASCKGPTNNPGCAVQVVITYNFKFLLPFLPQSTYQIHSTSEMIISQ